MSLKKEEIFTHQKVIESKKCSRCNLVLPHSAFYRNKSRKDGLESYCKECAKARNLAKRIKNKRQKPFSREFCVVFNGFPDEKVFVGKLQSIIEEVLEK